MPRFLKIVGIAAAVLVGLIILVLVVVNLIPGEYYKTLIISGVRSSTGRELTIEGELDISLFTTFTFKTSDIKFSNAEWGSRPHMVSVDNIKGELALFPLLRSILEATLVVDNPEMFLETQSSGQGNWQFGDLAKDAEEETESGGGLLLRLLIRKLHLNGTRIAFIDGKSGKQFDFESKKLVVETIEDRLTVDVTGKLNNIPLGLTGGLDHAEFFIDNPSAKVEFDGYFGDAKLMVQGTVGPLSPTFDLDVTLAMDTDSVAVFSPLVGKDLPKLGPVSVSVRLTGKGGKYAISDLLAKLDDKTLSVEAAGSMANLKTLDGLKLTARVDTSHLTEILKGIGYQPEYKLPDSVNAVVVAEGSLKDLAVKQFQIKIQGQGVNATANGKVKNIIALEGVQADLSLTTESLDIISKIVKIELPPLGSLTASAGIASKGDILEVKDIKANLTGEHIQAKVAGSIGDLLKMRGINATVDLDVKSLAFLSKYLKTELPPFAPLKVTAGVASKHQNSGLMEITGNLTGNMFRANVAGSIKDPIKLKAINVNVDLGIESLAWLSDYFHMKLPPLGSLTASANIASKGNTFEVKDIKAKLTGENIQATLVGSVGDLLKVQGVNTAVDLNVKSLAFLSDYIQIDLPPLGPLKASAGIVSKGDGFEIMDLKAALAGEGIYANVAGSIGDLLELKEINADINLGIDSLALLSEYVGTDLPSLGPLQASATLTSKGETFELINIKADLTGKKLQANATGSIGDLLKLKEINTNVHFKIASIDLLSEYVGVKLPPLGPLIASADVASKGETFEVKNIQADLASEKIQAKVAGSMEDLLKLTGIKADFYVAVDSLTSLDPLVKQELPASGPVRLEGKISSKGGLYSPISITTMVKSDGFSANLTGRIAEPLAAKGIDLAVTLEADSMQKVGKLTGGKFQGKKPVKLKGNFIADENVYKLTDLHLQVGELDVKGQAAFMQPSEPGGQPKISGELYIGELDFSKQVKVDMDTLTKTKSSPESNEEEEEVKRDKVFSSEPLPFGTLKAVDADIKVTIESLTTLQIQLEDLVAGLTLDNGLLSLQLIRAKVGNGTFDGIVMIDISNTPTTLTADIEMSNATFRNFGGKINFIVDLNGSGDSIAAIMASLDGQLELDIQGVTLKKSFMTRFGSSIIDSLNPFRKNEKETELNCAIILFDIKDSVANANRQIAAQMTDITWFGSGKINLKTEEIYFQMNPKPRKGLGISLGNLAKIVHIRGTLAEPKIVLDPKELAVKYGKYSLGVATGGLAWAAELLWNKIKANTDVCEIILKNLNSKKASKGKKSKQRPPQ